MVVKIVAWLLYPSTEYLVVLEISGDFPTKESSRGSCQTIH